MIKIKIDLHDEYIFVLCRSISNFTFDDLDIRFPKTEFYNNFEIFEIEYLQNCLKENFNREELKQEKLKILLSFYKKNLINYDRKSRK